MEMLIDEQSLREVILVASRRINEERIDSLQSTILKAYTTSTLSKLEDYRIKSGEEGFRLLILSLATKLNKSDWIQPVQNQACRLFDRRFHSKKIRAQIPDRADINRCSIVVLYYIVSVIHKYKITDAEPIWREILNNSVARKIPFYRFLHKNKIIIPEAICTHFSEQFDSFYSSQSSKDKIILIQLGFTFNIASSPSISIKEWEILFTELKRQQLYNINLKPYQFVSAMVTAEELSLFLSYFSDYDLNTIDPRTNHNILDQIINMKPYFYLAPEDKNNTVQLRSRFLLQYGLIQPRDTDRSKIGSHPNEITKYRAARILNLLQSVVLQDAQLSKPFYQEMTYIAAYENRFFTTSIGMYALIGLRLDDIYPDNSSREHARSFVTYILKSVNRFQPTFQEFILHHLSISYSLIHKNEFIVEQRTNETIQTQAINDELFQKSLTLKEWCRLKIKDACSQKNIIKLDLSKSLIDYCSFGLFSSNYALKCIKEVIRHKGHIMPGRAELENEIVDVPDIDNSDNELNMDTDLSDDYKYANSSVYGDSFEESDENW